MLHRIKFLKYLLLDREDNPELVSLLAALSFIAFIVYSSYAYLWAGQHFTPMEFGTGAASLIGALGAGKWMGAKGDYDAR